MKDYMCEYDSLVSIIVPIYNVSDYLDACIESLVNQTYDNIEIILINDGSPDDSEEKCLKWKAKDDRIIYISKKNEKLGPTRTIGVRVASGAWITFVDSDDWIEPNYIEELYYSAKKWDADFAFCDVYEWEQEERKTAMCALNIDATTSFAENPMILYSIRPAMWNKIYKRSLFVDHKIAIPAYQSEEFCVFPAIIYYAKRISQVKKPLYNYRKDRQGNIVTTGLGLCQSFPKVVKYACEYCHRQGIWEELSPWLKAHFTRQFLFCFYQGAASLEKKLCVTEELLQDAYDAVDAYYPEWSSNLFNDVEYLLFGSPELRNYIQVWNPVASFFSSAYLSRYSFSSLAALFNGEVPEGDFMQPQETNVWRRDMADRERKRQLVTEVSNAAEKKERYFVFDFLEERYDIWCYKGKYLTLNPMNRFLYEQIQEGEVIQRDTAQAEILWKQGCDKLISLLDSHVQSDHIILVRSFASPHMRDYESSLDVETINRILSGYYDYVEEKMPGIKVIEAGKPLSNM